MSPSFIHLRVHSEYSLVDGVVRIKPLVKAVAEAGMPAVAITDQSNLFAMVKFYRAALAVGVKPIVGVDAWLHNEQDPNKPARLVLLAQDYDGYRNLTRLVSRGYREGQRLGVPVLARGWLKGSTDGLIALSGGRAGDIGQALLAGNQELAEQRLDDWLALFGDRYYLELQRTGREQEEDCLHATVALAARRGVPVVATNDVHFIAAEDFEAHEARVCIHDGRTLQDSRRPRNYSAQQYLRSPAEMAELFADIPEALDNSLEIARRCNLELTLGKNFLPDFPVPEGLTTNQYFAQCARDGLQQRALQLPQDADPAEWRKTYDERLQLELDVIIQMGFPGYFLIVADFIQWARDHGVPVGPGRGSGAGSLVAYALKITDLDPIEHELLFERFLNPERVSMPDFDVDFCMEGRDRVIDYVGERYGRDSVSQIITYGSMAAKAVVRDVGRVLGHPYGFVDRIAKLVPFELGITLDKALEQEEELRNLYRNEDEVRALIDLARSLEGLARNAGKHAGGVVIAPTVLTDFAPLYCEAGGENLVTQFDKDDVEAVGLVKFDFLGLRTLTIIDWALKTVNAQLGAAGQERVDIESIPMDDPASFALLKRADTTAVFQLESRGMKELIKKLQPDCFEDIVALVALYRPGPLGSGMVDDFINRKHGRAKVAYPHPELETILKPTYGTILYQEQVMQIAQVLAGYSLGGADLLRRAMGKKKQEVMDEQRAIFVNGATDRGVDEKVATYIFDLMAEFAKYGFNKSHSAAYALVSYQTAWLKAHYPAAFMAAVLSADMDHTDKVVTFIEECRGIGLEVLPPHVNRSAYKFTVDGEKTVIYGLGAIKGVGEAAIEGIIQERERAGRYADLFEFCRRIDLRKANRRVLEALIRSGALDELGPNRATLMAQLPLAVKMAEQHGEMKAAGQRDLFGLSLETGGSDAPDSEAPSTPRMDDWDEDLRLTGEKETLGLYLTGHPILRYQDELRQMVSAPIADLSLKGEAGGGNGRRGRGQPVTVAGLVVGLRHTQTQRGRMAFVTLDDRSGRVEIAVFSELYQQSREMLATDTILVVEGNLSVDDFNGGFKISADRLLDMEQARSAHARHLLIRLNADDAGAAPSDFVQRLNDVLTPFVPGKCPLRIAYRGVGARGDLMLAPAWSVRPTDELLKRLRQLLGDGGVEVVHGPTRPAATPAASAPPRARRTQ